MDESLSVLEQITHYLENNAWDIISTVAALFSAIFIPVRIACKQNQIALFEKRFEAYSVLLKLRSFSNGLKREEWSLCLQDIEATEKEPEKEKLRRCREILTDFQVSFHNGQIGQNEVEEARITLSTIRSLELSLHTLPMLYSRYFPKKGENINREVTEICTNLARLMISIVQTPSSTKDKYRANFVSTLDSFFEKYADIFEKHIRL